VTDLHSPAKPVGVPRYPRFHSAHHNNKLYSFLKKKTFVVMIALLCLVKKLSVRDLVHEIMWCPLITAFPQYKGCGGPR
jgi:hypothetical protein